MFASGTWLAAPVIALVGFSLGVAPTCAQESETDEVTYTRDIATILDTHCVVCHRPGGIGPFRLDSYEDVAGRSQQIATATRSGEMPPWKPRSGPGYLEFQGARTLDVVEVDLIQSWVTAGSPEGEPREPLDASVWSDGWHAGAPDLVVTMPESYDLSAYGDDVHRNFVVHIPGTEERFVRAVELRADTTRGIHHARLMIDQTDSARRLDDTDPLPGYDVGRADQARFPEGHFLGWAPGTLAGNVPDELAWRLEPGSDFVLKTHLVPTGTPTAVRVSVGFFFADTRPTVAPVVLQLGSQTIDLPAGDSAHIVEDTYHVPVDVDVLAVYPHAHFLATDVQAFASLPDGTTRRLIHIDSWDFNWQDQYRYAAPVRLPAGTTIGMRYVFDNSARNPSNPNRPPARVRFGPRSTDEMAELTLQVVPVDGAARPALAAHAQRKVTQILLAGAQKRLIDEPDHVAAYENAAIHLARLGRNAEAVEYLETAIRVDPQHATAHYRLGTALVTAGRHAQAAQKFRRAIALQPDFTAAHNNLGSLLQLAGEFTEAAIHYHHTLQLQPDHAGAHFNLATISLGERRFAEAEARFRQALAVRPGFRDAHEGLGRALTGQGRLVEARKAFVRAGQPSASVPRQ